MCELLKRLKKDSCCDEYIEQLIPSSTPIAKIKMKVFGSSAVGKTSLIESLKAGYFSGLFRRSKRGSVKKTTRPKGEKGPDFKLNHFCVSVFRFLHALHRCISLVCCTCICCAFLAESAPEEPSTGGGDESQKKSGGAASTSWQRKVVSRRTKPEHAIGGADFCLFSSTLCKFPHYELMYTDVKLSTFLKGFPSSPTPTTSAASAIDCVTHDQYTKGIEIHQSNLGTIGDLSIWEFSGDSNYHGLYDHFIGNINCIHIVLFSLEDTAKEQMEQLRYWMTFLKSRIPPVEPLGKLLISRFL